MTEDKRLDVEQAKQTLGEPTDFRLTRDGDLDVEFTGWKISVGRHGTGGSSGYQQDWNRGTVVRVYLTIGGKYLVGVHHWSHWQGEEGSFDVTVFADAAGMVEHLRGQDDELGVAQKEALENAVEKWAPLAGHDVEVVQ